MEAGTVEPSIAWHTHAPFDKLMILGTVAYICITLYMTNSDPKLLVVTNVLAFHVLTVTVLTLFKCICNVLDFETHWKMT